MDTTMDNTTMKSEHIHEETSALGHDGGTSDNDDEGAEQDTVDSISLEHGSHILTLSISRDAMTCVPSFYSPSGVVQGTRTEIRAQIKEWLELQRNLSSILWLFGPPNVGKSVSAETSAELCRANNQLGGTFFFRTKGIEEDQTHFLFTTLAYQLAYNVPGLLIPINRIMCRNPTLPTKSMDTQFDSLIVEAFAQYTPTPPVPTYIIILDRLDECPDEELQLEILRIIERSTTELKLPLRFIITSRPEPHLRTAFTSDPLYGVTQEISMDDQYDSTNHDPSSRSDPQQERHLIPLLHRFSRSRLHIPGKKMARREELGHTSGRDGYHVARNGPTPPASIAELSDKATLNLWDDSEDFKHYLTMAEKYRKEGQECARRGDLEGAYVELARATTLMLETLPMHRDYNGMLNANQRNNLSLNGQDILDELSALKPILVDRYDQWLQEQTPNAPAQDIAHHDTVARDPAQRETLETEEKSGPMKWYERQVEGFDWKSRTPNANQTVHLPTRNSQFDTAAGILSSGKPAVPKRPMDLEFMTRFAKLRQQTEGTSSISSTSQVGSEMYMLGRPPSLTSIPFSESFSIASKLSAVPEVEFPPTPIFTDGRIPWITKN